MKHWIALLGCFVVFTGCAGSAIKAQYVPYYDAGIDLSGATPEFSLDLSERSATGFRSVEIHTNRNLFVKNQSNTGSASWQRVLTDEEWLWWQQECLRAGYLGYDAHYQGDDVGEVRIDIHYGESRRFSVLEKLVPSGLGRSLDNINRWLIEKQIISVQHFQLAKPLTEAGAAEGASKE